MNFDTIFRSVTLYDGTGSAPVVTDVGVTGETISAIGDLSTISAPCEINGLGKALTPGFIDVHTHSDAFLLIEPMAPSKLLQGVTTEITGQCGGSAAPRLNGARLPSDWEAQVYPARPGREQHGPNWDTVADYRTCLEAAKPAINILLFAGHNTIRKGVLGNDTASHPASPEEVQAMTRALEQALDEGAWGLSTGLIYYPGVYSTPEEVQALVSACARRGGMYATHMRSESDKLLEAVDEVLNLARTTGIHVEISHLKTSGRANWSKIDPLLAKLNAARDEGLWLHSDRYPYLSAGTDLDIVLPDWAAEGGNAGILKRLDDDATRAKIADELNASGRDPSSIMIGGTWHPENRALGSRSIAQIMEDRHQSMGEVIVEILRLDRSRTGAFFFSMNEDNMLRILREPWIMVGSDASIRAPWGSLGRDWPHPRAYGTHALFYKTLTQRLGIAPEVAIHRMTGLAAEAFGIPKRGVVKVGNYADLVLLDLAKYDSSASYATPHVFATGVDTVMVNGSSVVRGGQMNPMAQRRGRLLTRS